MDVYYQAYDAQGRRVDGVVSCNNESEAVEKLRLDGLIPFATSRHKVNASLTQWLNREISFGKSRSRLEDRAIYCRMLSAMLKAGLPPDKANQLLAKGQNSRQVSALAAVAAEQLAAGQSLSHAMEMPVAGFSAAEAGLIKAGEMSGSLASALEELAALLQRRVELRSRLLSACLYPIVLAFMAIVSIAVIVLVLAPNVAPLFRQSDRELPLMIFLALALRSLLTEHGTATLVAVTSAIGLGAVLARTASVKTALAGVTNRLAIPRLVEAARLCRTLGTLLAHGIALQSALALTAAALQVKRNKDELLAARERVISGTRLADALRDVSVLPASSLDLIRVGEDTNSLDTFLIHSATLSEQEASRKLERFVTILTPLFTIVLGLLIGGLIMSVMRAILSINETVLP